MSFRLPGTRPSAFGTLSLVIITLLLLPPPRADAQASDTTPAFTLASGQIFNSRERPSFTLLHRQVDHLDFRVYRVQDAFAFFAGLRDLHQLGSEEPVVPQERTALERVALWKSRMRGRLRGFVRAQFSPSYRAARNERLDRQQVVQRRTSSVNTFAQVPLLNASQLVTSWREHLPRVRDPEYRRVPLEIPAPGVYVVEAVHAPLRAYTVVIVSDVGLVSKTSPGELLVYAANRFSGEPLADCRIEVIASQTAVANGATASDGTFRTAVDPGTSESLVTVAVCGGQAAATDPGAFSIRQEPGTLVGYTYTDRPVYRPGHTVRYKSILRWRQRGELSRAGLDTAEVSIADETGAVLRRERRPLDEFGSLSGSFTIPPLASLGYYSIRIARGDDVATGSFEVLEYRKPEFDVAVTPAARLHLQGERAAATIAARYYFGQPVAGASVTYVVHRQPYYSPLRYDPSGGEEESYEGYAGGEQILQGTATLDDEGTAQIVVPLPADAGGRDYLARIEARVTDSSGREVAGAASVVATYGRFLVVAQAERYVYSRGAPAAVSLRALDYDGMPQPGIVMRVFLERVDYRRGYADTNADITLIQQREVTSGADGTARWTFQAPDAAGSYRVRVTAGSGDRELSDTAFIWVPGPTTSEFEGDQYLELIADRREYRPGDTARLIVRGAEFESAVLVTKEAGFISYHQVVTARGNEAIAVPIGEDDTGDVYVSIAFLKDDRLYRAERRLTVPADGRRLTITAAADREVVRPGEPGVFSLRVVDAAGAPVRAQLSVGVVDEAVYGVRPDNTPDPVRFFYRREYNRVYTSFSRDYSFVGHSGTEQLLLARRRGPMTLADFKAERPGRPRVRKEFPDTALWLASVTTDAEGRATVSVDYPDSLTTWRLTVRAVTPSTALGTATAHTTTTKDLILRVVAPRFLTEGDRVSIPTVVHNYLPEAKTVSLSVSADGLTPESGAERTRSVQVASNGETRTDWTFTAGRVRPVAVTGTATTDAAGDAVEISLPVLPAGLQRTSGSSGSIVETGERALQLTVPASANASSRSVRVSLAPSLAGAMLGALDYLTSYPYGCTEQTLSSFIPNLTVLRALDDMQLSPTERLQSLDRQVSDGLKRLYDYQHEDGGWGWWKTDQNDPFMTAYALDGLLQARAHGVRLEGFRIFTAARALQQLYARYPRAVPDLKAYMVYVLIRALAPEDSSFDAAAALDELWEARSRMTASGRAVLLMTLDARKDPRAGTLTREIVSTVETRGDVAWWTVTSDPFLSDFVDTSVEATALSLQALAARDPQNPLLERAARWLMLSRSGGYWVSTKQTALALQGLLAYMRARGERPAPFTAVVYVNGQEAATRSFDADALTSPRPVLVEAPASAGSNDIRIVKRGGGTLYYDAAVRYYDRPAEAEYTGSRRLALGRSYATLSPVTVGGRIVYREGPFTGTASPGDLLLVRLTAAGSADWRYLVLEDPIPAGTETVERESVYELERRRDWFRGTQRELRDDRTAFFLTDFTAGRYEFTYLLRVTTPGTFSAMPARISPMYVPDVTASTPAVALTVSSETRK